MAQKDGEASVEDILRSIKQVISREDGPRRSADTFARDAARENGQPVPERPASFSPYAFQRHSPFGARGNEAPPADLPEEAEDEGRTDVFDLRSLDSDAFEVDEPDTPEHPATESEPAPIVLHAPETVTELPETDSEPDDDAYTPYVEEAFPPVGEDDDGDDDGDGDSGDDSDSYAAPVDVADNEEPLDLAAVEPEPAPEPNPEPEPAPQTAAEGLIAGAAADALRNRFSALQEAASTSTGQAAAPAPANPLEDMVREMMRPMLKQWLDDNMPGLVEKIVEREIARITGRL
jgi:uncharacterized protein